MWWSEPYRALTSRRTVLATLAGGVLAMPFRAGAQARTPRIGFASHVVMPPGTPGFKLWTEGVDAFRQELRRLGHVEGQSFSLQVRPDGEVGVRELLQANVDVLVAVWSPTALAAKRATSSVPIVAVGPRDPVEQGLVQSLARPGGNVTGISSSFAVRGGGTLKRLEVLRELVPRLTRVGFLTNLSFPGAEPFVPVIERAAPRLGLVVQTFDVRSEPDIDKAFAEMVRGGVNGVVLGAELNTSRIVTLAAKHRLPAVHTLRQTVDEGGLIAWDIDRMELFRRGAYLVDRILKGAKPADLPFEQPTKFEIAINLKTAKVLGLTVPPALLLRATHVVE